MSTLVTCAWLSVMALHAAVFLSLADMEDSLSAEQRAAIESALPRHAEVPPRAQRRLLVFDHNVNYGGHPSARHANYALVAMGQRTGAFEAAVSRDPSVFERETLKAFDAIFFNNNVGNLFEESHLRQNLLEFVLTGGGLLGVHGTAVAFTRWPGAHEDWPEFALMIGARGANHRIDKEHVFIQLDDVDHPLNRVFSGRDFEYRDEFFRVHEPYSRERLRILFRIDTSRTDMNQGPAYGRIDRDDQDYALAWIRSYGRGRTFYCTIAHNPYVFSDPLMLKFYLDAIQFAFGDLSAPTTPSARLTPAVRAQEKLGWQVVANALTTPHASMTESLQRASAAGYHLFNGSYQQQLDLDSLERFAPALDERARSRVRSSMDEVGMRLISLTLPFLPADEYEARKILAWASVMGVEHVILEEIPEALEPVADWCDTLDLQLALDCSGLNGWSQLCELIDRCRESNSRVGVRANLNDWIRMGYRPDETVELVRDRLRVVNMPGEIAGLNGHGDHIKALEPWLRALHKFVHNPLLFTHDLSTGPDSFTRESFDALSLKLMD